MTQELFKKEIEKTLKRFDYEIKDIEWEYLFEKEDGEDMIYNLEQMDVISFGAHHRSSEMDGWYQIEYYSKIGKTIIFDYDFQESFDDFEDFVNVLWNTEQAIKKFEKRLELSLEDCVIDKDK